MGLLDRANLDKAKGLIGKNADKVRGGIDTAAGMASRKLGRKVDDEQIDECAEKAKDVVDQLAEDAGDDQTDA